ncbi:hypothetical protein, partial [Pseudomonas sp. RA_35y_Pfl2_P32]|uniref:hypothetical protein n=1 Tax=Pseudomonas sp. RA_35y_Pfl2_P32 TaxID=3088705 RepID=UPI00403F1159
MTYTVTRDGKPTTSLPLTLSVGALPVTELNSPMITDADANNVLDVVALGTRAGTIHARVWALIAEGQQVWMSLLGKKADGLDHNTFMWAGGSKSVNRTWVEQGYWPHSVTNSYFTLLAHDSTLTLTFKAALDKSNKVENALVFPNQVYTIKAIELVTPTITSVKG